jgi:hypothetical protein
VAADNPQTINEEAGLGPNWKPIDAPPITARPAPPSVDMITPVIPQYFQGSLDRSVQHDADFVNTALRSSSAPRFALMPPGVQSSALTSTQITSVIQSNAGVSVPPDVDPVVSDGLIHGDAIWESDSAYVLMRDDFISSSNNSGSNTANNIGAYYWNLTSGVAPPTAGFLSSYPPYIGQFVWTNTATASAASWLTLPVGGPGTSSVYASSVLFALGETPAWKATFIFKLESAQDLTAATGTPFTKAGRSIYIGFMGSDFSSLIVVPISRPTIFMGLRFDTSVTSPSINDSFYTFEVVTNNALTAGPARQNAQGNTFVTNVVPTAGVWQRLDILCTTAGTVTMTLNGGNSFTTTIPAASVTFGAGGSGFSVDNGVAKISATVSPNYFVFGAGSTVVVSGAITANTNGTHVLTGASSSSLEWASSVPQGFSNTGATVVGYPVYTPLFMMGNSDVAGPTASTMMMDVDYFSFVWNPGVGSGGTGTPDPTKARYF